MDACVYRYFQWEQGASNSTSREINRHYSAFPNLEEQQRTIHAVVDNAIS